ncbi:MAG: PEP-CTERM sorting domain-containing protein [Candidatus Didemnitutus sp.]|nr:PEP-CTERM sorting domain-containing protein [Candidatus Didemnitutus sp.]
MKRYLLPVVAALVFSATAAAQTLVNENFNSYTNAGLIGQGGWVITGTSTVNPITVSSGTVPMANTGQDVRLQFTNVEPASGNSLSLSAQINLSAVGAGDYFLHLGDMANTSTFYSRIYARTATGGYQLGLMAISSGTITYGTEVLSLNNNYTITAVWNFVAGTLNDTITLTVNGLASPYHVHTWNSATAEPTLINSVNLRQGGGAAAPALVIDNIIVTAIPEPSTYAALFGALALVGVIAHRRRQKRAA